MFLSSSLIKQHRIQGKLIIEPFVENQLQPNSYDITIGDHIARFRKKNSKKVYLEDDAWSFLDDTFPIEELYEIQDCPRYIPIAAGERILSHTNEFFGSRYGSAPSLATRSTIARLGLDICGSAGFGDIGYVNRWTLELQNNSPNNYHIMVGTKVGQVYFNTVSENSGGIRSPTHVYDGQYQFYPESYTHEEMLLAWEPKMMLPKSI